MTLLRIATRTSDLAMAQTRQVLQMLQALAPETQFELVKLATSGDQDRSSPLWKLEGTGFFTTQIEAALKSGLADIAVHSYKDLPTCTDEALVIAAVCDRRFVEDVLVAPRRMNLDAIAAGARVGTSSLRRIAQLKRIRPDLQPITIRGNVPSRIEKLERGQYDALILARAGLERLGFSSRISQILPADEFIPAPAQGALAIETRVDDSRARQLVEGIDDNASRVTACSERTVLEILEGGCHAPVGVHAVLRNDDLAMTAFVSDLDGTRYIKDSLSGPANSWHTLALQLANSLLAMGGREILEGISKA